MNEMIQRALHDDEQVLLVAQPQKFTVLNSANKKSVVLQSVIAGILGLGPLLLCLILQASGAVWGISAVVLVIAFFVFMLPFSEATTIKHLDYVITDQRVMCLTGSRVNSSLLRSEITRVQAIEEADGGMTLLINDGIDLQPKQRRKKADEGVLDKEEVIVGMVLCNLPKDTCDKAVAMLQNSPLAMDMFAEKTAGEPVVQPV